MSREILKAYRRQVPVLEKSDYIGRFHTPEDYVIFGV